MPKPTIRIRVKGQSITLPEWVVEKYGSKDNADESKVVDTSVDRHSCNSGLDEETDGWKEQDMVERDERTIPAETRTTVCFNVLIRLSNTLTLCIIYIDPTHLYMASFISIAPDSYQFSLPVRAPKKMET